MRHDFINILILTFVFLLLFASAEWMYLYKKVKPEVTRKYVHVSTGLLTFLFPVMLHSHWSVLLLCGSFLLLLIGSLHFGFLPSINAVKRKTYGSLLFPIVVYGCYLIADCTHQQPFFYLPILVLSVSDPLAALVGKRFHKGAFVIAGHTKTLSGSFAFFISASFSLWVYYFVVGHTVVLWNALLIALLATIAEALSQKGFDNMTIPASVILGLWLMNNL